MLIASNMSNFATKADLADVLLKVEKRFNESDRKMDALRHEMNEVKNIVNAMQNKIDTMRDDIMKDVNLMIYRSIRNAVISASIIATGISAILALLI